MVVFKHRTPVMMNVMVGDTVSNSIAFTIATLKNKWKRIRRNSQKKVYFADEIGEKLCRTRTYERVSFRHPNCQQQQQQQQNCCSNIVDVNRVKGLTNYKVVFQEEKLLHNFVCVIAYGIVGEKSVFGAIQVRNMRFDKQVVVRLTLNKWKSSVDVEAKFSTHEEDGESDRFFFVAPLIDDIGSGVEVVADKMDVEFAVCYKLDELELWDNNDGQNYSFDYLNESE